MRRQKLDWQKQSKERRCAFIQVLLISKWPRFYWDADDMVIELRKEFIGLPLRGKHLSALLNKTMYATGKIGRKLKLDENGVVIPGSYLWCRG